jgi:hypothetical protein
MVPVWKDQYSSSIYPNISDMKHMLPEKKYINLMTNAMYKCSNRLIYRGHLHCASVLPDFSIQFQTAQTQSQHCTMMWYQYGTCWGHAVA